MATPARRVFRPLFHWVVRPLLKRYLKSTRRYRYRGITVTVPAGVFHPRFFFSTRFLLSYLDGVAVSGRSVLELGAGSGLVALWLARRGATVTASDINPAAVAAVRANAVANGVALSVQEADLFDGLAGGPFDGIVINPPYYPGTAGDAGERAWYYGEDYAYFRRLFAGAGDHLATGGAMHMVLSEDCGLAPIRELAEAAGWMVTVAAARHFWGERLEVWVVAPLRL